MARCLLASLSTQKRIKWLLDVYEMHLHRHPLCTEMPRGDCFVGPSLPGGKESRRNGVLGATTPEKSLETTGAPSAAVNALGLTRKPCSSWHQLPGPGLFWATPAACSCFRLRLVFAEAKGRNQTFPLKGRNLAAPSIRVLGLRRSADRPLALFAFRSW